MKKFFDSNFGPKLVVLFTNYLETRVPQANEIDVVKYFYSNFRQKFGIITFQDWLQGFFFFESLHDVMMP